MAEAKWDHTASVIAYMVNVHVMPKKGQEYSPDDFNPYKQKRRQGKGIPITAENIGMLKAMVKGKSNGQ